MNPYLAVCWGTFQFCLLTAPDTLCPLEITTVTMAVQAAARPGLSCLRSFKADVFWLTVENEVRPHLLTDLLGVCAPRQPPDQNPGKGLQSQTPQRCTWTQDCPQNSPVHMPGLASLNRTIVFPLKTVSDFEWRHRGSWKMELTVTLFLFLYHISVGKARRGGQMKTSPLDQWPGTLKSGAAES